MNTFGGNDVLIAGHGREVMFGGEGADTFVYRGIHDAAMGYATTSYNDVLRDFSVKDHDKLDLSAMDANGKAEGNGSFDFIGTHDLDHHAGELHVFYGKRFTYVAGDVTGDGKDDFEIALTGYLHLTQHSLEL